MNVSTKFTKADFFFLTIMVLLSLFVFAEYGWISYSIFTDRHGFYGDLYWYYRADKVSFACWQLIMAILALATLITLLYFSYRGNRLQLRKGFKVFAVFFTAWIISEIYLYTQYVGKG